MKTILRICLRDTWSLLVVPTGAVVAALFTFACAIVFMSKVFSPNSIATMQPVFEFAAWLLLLLCPAITMRLIAEERRVGTWELLLASPISSFELAKGKFLSAFLYLLLLLITTLPLVVALELYSSVDYGTLFSGYVGLLLLGSAVIGTGLVASALTTSQTVAYLVTAFIWLTLSLSMKVLPVYVPTRFADIFFSIDPDLRFNAFSIGLIDTANIVYFASIAIAMGWVTIVAIEKTRFARCARWKMVLSVLLLIVSVVSINCISMNNQFRARIDATGSRAYTLSEQTSKLLEQLDSPLDIVVLLDDSTINDSVVRQVDEVLRRYKNSSPHIEVQRINPANPDSIDAYDALLRALIELYADEVAISNAAIKEGTYQFTMLIEFASSTSAWAEALLELSLTPKEQETFQTLAGALSLLGDEGHLILGEVDKAMDVTESQPLPNVSFARDILVAATGQWSKELAEVARWLSQGRSDSISEICKTESVSFQFMAATLAEVEMKLRELGELELGQIATQLAIGEGALILSEDGATMIPSNLLFPEQFKVTDSIAVDHRFRGEQIISSAIRSLLADSMPTVVFVHAEENSLRLQQPNNADIRAVAHVLETSRFNVEEWNPVDEVKPFFDNEPVVWVIVPPPNRAGLEPSPREKKLIEVVNGLIDDNQSILLNIQPSLLPRYGHEDPWNRIAKRLGFSIDSERVLVERVASGQNTLELQRSQMVQNPRSEHTISNAIRGLQIFIPLPIAIEGGNSLINIQPSEDRWLDQIWERDHIELESKQPLEHSISIASAIEMPSGNRAIIVGSGGWFLTWATDRVMSLGGDQVALVNPGNIELFLTSVEWLSGLDEWIASGAIGNQTTRIEGLSETGYLTWAVILVLGVPGLLLTGATMHSIGRQRR